jgi:hypothetical protein|tara:strand:- start:2843 stop:3133 length:291 start_codon:yes stop_codon:yes gene_type:complete
MSSWSNTDEAASAPLWSVAAIKKTPSSANRTDLFNDTTADNFISGVTMGLFNYKDSETAANKVAHAGWNLKTTGSGGRSGRVSHECLVALTNSADA